MAEAVFKDTVKQKGLESRFNIDSAGTGNYHQHGVPVDHYARQVVKQDFKEFDYILCMDNSNLTSLQRTKPKDSKATIKLFGEYDPQGERLIQDPYYGGIGGFEKNFQQVTRCSEAFIESLNLE
ncbi:15235_t:CDS:2 [Funneliformis caledonium]|uniref:15235_t:CDS:1 n=1 Tax=Funneliformis caledonium TaxID=1117310 RepID=A0A9N9FDE2_9GLOM|nr:15235_t:CDS:2 [Funneliformis caledonium]